MGRPRAAWWVNLGAEAVAASTGYQLIDLSDTTNYPHPATFTPSEIHLLALKINAEKASDGRFDVWVGVVIEVDATDGSVDWIHVWHLEADGNPTDGTDRFAQDLDFTLDGQIEGLNCAVVGGAMTKFAAAQTQADNVTWQTDTGLLSPVGAAGGATGKPGAGDVVVWIEEVTDGGTIDFSISACYEVA
jgi:hypothetical protein